MRKVYKESSEKLTRLCAPVEIPGKGSMTLFFETDIKWDKYFVDELSDAFVLAVLKRAMKNDWNILFETPMSEELCYQLETYGIPVLSKYVKAFHSIRLNGKITSDKIISENKVGTGFSAGVDSFYTVLKHMNSRFPSRDITHLILARNGAASSSEPEIIAKKWFEETNKKLAPYAQKMRLEYIPIWSNIPDFYWRDQFGYGDLIVTSSFIHALRKLFGVYYWASAYEAGILDFKKFDETTHSAYIDPFIIPLVSVKSLKFYHSGSEVSRVQKVDFIADHELVQKSITPCGSETGKNCGRCVKCYRTMAELNALGKLEKFRESFPVDDYLKREKWNLAHELAMDHPPFTTDIIKAMRAHGKKIGWTVYIREWLIYKPLEFGRKKLKNVYWARKLYYSLNLDEKIGVKNSEEIRKIQLEECRKNKSSRKNKISRHEG